MLCVCTAGAASFLTYGGSLYEEVWQSVRDQTSFVFRVAACSDAHLALTSFVRNALTRTYKIVLGSENNKFSMIGRDALDGNAVKVSTPDLLSCTLTQYMWVQWNHKVISVGRGMMPGENGFMSYQDSDQDEPYEIRAVAVGTQQGVRGTWQFEAKEREYGASCMSWLLLYLRRDEEPGFEVLFNKLSCCKWDAFRTNKSYPRA